MDVTYMSNGKSSTPHVHILVHTKNTHNRCEENSYNLFSSLLFSSLLLSPVCDRVPDSTAHSESRPAPVLDPHSCRADEGATKAAANGVYFPPLAMYAAPLVRAICLVVIGCFHVNKP